MLPDGQRNCYKALDQLYFMLLTKKGLKHTRIEYRTTVSTPHPLQPNTPYNNLLVSNKILKFKAPDALFYRLSMG